MTNVLKELVLRLKCILPLPPPQFIPSRPRSQVLLSEFPTFDLHSSRSPCALQKAAVQLPAGLQKEAVVPAAASARHSAASPICPGIGLASKKAKKSIQNVQLGIVPRATRGDVWGRQNILSQH